MCFCECTYGGVLEDDGDGGGDGVLFAHHFFDENGGRNAVD